MNQVSSFLENIIAVEDSQSASTAREHPVTLGERSHQSTQDLDNASVPDKSVDQTDSSSSVDIDLEEPEESTLSKAVALSKPYEGKVSDFWYLEDDQKKVSNQLTDRIMEKVLSVMLSTELNLALAKDSRAFIHKTRPPLLVHLMSINTTQTAQKTSPVFELLDEIAFSMGWYNSWHTIGVVLFASLLILRPYLLTTLPSLILLKKYLVPSYLKLYPPDPSVVDNKYIFHNPLLHEGAPLRKYEPPKQISQFSREFIMNFTDLQNHMVLYIRTYDALVNWGQHYFFFEHQRLSSVVYLILLGSIIFNLLALPYIVPFFFRVFPVKLIMLAIVWLTAVLLHPLIRRKVMDTFDTEEAREARRDRADRIENMMIKSIAEDKELPEDVVKELEVFELHSLNANKIWEPIGFTSDFFALNNPKRHLDELSANPENTESNSGSSSTNTEGAGDRRPSHDEQKPIDKIFRKATLAEIKPPKKWRFAEDLWQIDLEPMNWVHANYIMDLVNVDTEEKWVYDFVAHDDSCDGQIFRRRRWIRQCVRDAEVAKESKDLLMGVTSSESFSKTFSTLLL